MTGLDIWLREATRHLSQDSAAKVRSEITGHYESAWEAAMAEGATSDEAGRRALEALGDAKIANRQYRRVLLTSAEARMLREGDWEARAVCGGRWLSWMILIRVAAFAALLLLSRFVAARDVLLCAIGMGPLLAAPSLPIYTRFRSRVYRVVKWVALTGAVVLLFGPEVFKWSWLLFSCLWPLALTEWTRASIRRKLPMAA